MSDRFRKAFRSLLICRDGSTRSEQRLCMAGYTTANHFEKSSAEGNINTRSSQQENPTARTQEIRISRFELFASQTRQ